jgi:hypothetical protein
LIPTGDWPDRRPYLLRTIKDVRPAFFRPRTLTRWSAGFAGQALRIGGAH